MAQPYSGYLYARNLVLLDARRTVSGSATTTSVDVSQFSGNGVTLVFIVDTVSSSGNVTATVQHSAASGSGQASITGATKNLTATGVSTLFVPNAAYKYLNLSWALNSGTSIAVTVLVYGQPQDATVNQGYTNAPQS